jgi:iron complex outermembrane receptor protein
MKAYLRSVLLLLICNSALAQFSITGVVAQAENYAPIGNVAVYAFEVNSGATTKVDGSFVLRNIKAGKVNLQFSHIGFQTASVVLNLSSDTSINISLSQSFIQGKEVVITGLNFQNYSSLTSNITSLGQNEMRENGSINLSDAMSKLPGVGQLTTGAGISKPVIRGLYGNRIQTVLMGMRFDNQQWQDEHGLGLSDAGVDKIEIIRGPAALIFGSEAMGGVLNIIEEKAAPNNKLSGNASTRFFSNTLGNATEIGFKKANEKLNWRVRAAYESHGDYQDGKNVRVLNSRWEGYNIKATLGFNKKNFVSQNYMMGSFNQFGFVMEDNQDRKRLDARYSRTMDGPKHLVGFGVLSSENTFFRGRSKIKFNLGFNANSRLENEGGAKISLNMLLNTFQAKTLWTYSLLPQLEITSGVGILFQTNTNFGSRVIVPDALLGEGSVFVHLKYERKNITLEAGLRNDVRGIGTKQTLNYNSPGDSVFPYTKVRDVFNGSLGASFRFAKYFYVKINSASGFRSGNLAELASNGLHEGTYRYEIGNPNMKAEQNINTELLIGVQHPQVSFSAAAYYNHFFNYIYLQGSGKQIYGFDIYNYLQKNARFFGAETDLNVNPNFAKWLEWNANYSLVRGQLTEGGNLPFVPADKFQTSLKFIWREVKMFRNTFAKIGSAYYFKQNRAAQFETVTNDYFLLEASIGTTVLFNKYSLQFSVVGNNLTNLNYADHLSRFKYYGINNIGRNIKININFQF